MQHEQLARWLVGSPSLHRQFGGVGVCRIPDYRGEVMSDLKPCPFCGGIEGGGVMERTNTVADISDAELLRRAVATCRPFARKSPKWVAVMDSFQLGSTYAHQLCRRFGIDPDQETRK